jgi:glycosyltransferase involved in cell wall biosynthesis
MLQVKTGRDGLSVVQVNCAFDKSLSDPEALLERYTTLTGWAEALLDAGAVRSAVVQRFRYNARIARNGVDYTFVADPPAAATAALSPDIVHVNGVVFPLEVWRVRRRLPRATGIVVQSHSDGGAIGRAPFPRLLRRATRGAVDAWMFAADAHAAAWRETGLIAPNQPAYSLMPASTTLEPLARVEAEAISGVRGDPAVLWVGRLNDNKDPLTVLDAFERVIPMLPHATLTMVYGTAELLAAVHARIERSEALRERVRLAGVIAHDRLAAWFSAADVFVVGSHHEGSGYSLMEALACGVTPAVTDIPSFRVLTGGGAVGVLWRPGNQADCTRAILAAAERDRISERPRVRSHFERHFSWAAIGRQAMQIYESVRELRA